MCAGGSNERSLGGLSRRDQVHRQDASDDLQEMRTCIRSPLHQERQSNSALWKHLRNKHNYNSGPTLDPPPSATIDALFTRTTGITTPGLQCVWLQTIVTCNWPFDQFDNLIFRHLLHHSVLNFWIHWIHRVRLKPSKSFFG